MALMLSKTYDALLAAGAPQDKAREAAEELAGYENRLASIDNRLAIIDGRINALDAKFEGRLQALEGKLTVIIWAMGVNAAATIAILGVLLRHGG
jgi:hypothetical protein